MTNNHARRVTAARAVFILDYGMPELFDKWLISGGDTGEAQNMMEKSFNRADAILAALDQQRLDHS